MTKDELGKQIGTYKEKTVLFPHPKVVHKNKKRKNIKENLSKER